MKNILIIVLGLIVIAGGLYLLIGGNKDVEYTAEPDLEAVTEDVSSVDVEELTEEEEVDKTKTLLGSSEGGNDIMAYHYGEGEDELLFIGGTHGGYSWNTALVAYELMDYLEENPSAIPDNVSVTVVPVLNPDGLDTVVGTTKRFDEGDVVGDTVPGRFNANNVDLNRNFDCDWNEKGTWQSQTVSGGDEAFSEAESKAIRKYVDDNDITAAVVWYSAAGGVFASSCHNGVLPETLALTNLYADASGYQAFEEFDFYEVTGDMVNWFAKDRIPAISVLLTTHEDVEWNKNKEGVEALLKHYSEF